MDTSNDKTTEAKVCPVCGHDHKGKPVCDCGCTEGEKMDDKKTCSMCGHLHDKEDGSCSCGCGSM